MRQLLSPSRRPFLLVPIFLPVLAALTLNTDLQRRIESGLERYIDRIPEKVYVHTDKPYYSAGETLWFKAYLVDAVDHRTDVLSGVLYVELPPRQIAGRYLEAMSRVRQVERAFDGMSILLDEVEVTARPLVPDRYNRPGNLHGKPDFRAEADSLLQYTAPTSALNLLINANFPGISVIRRAPVPDVRWRTIPVTFLLDGMNVDAELIAALDATDVDFIDFIRPPNSGVYGLRGGPAGGGAKSAHRGVTISRFADWSIGKTIRLQPEI